VVRTVRQQACHSLLREIMSTNDTFGDTDELYDEGSASSVVLGIAAGFLIGLLIRTVSSLVPYRWRKFSLPFTASMLIAGLLCGLIVVYANPSDGMTAGLEQLEGINPTVLFAVFMPALITPSGLSLEYHTVNHIWFKAFALAIPGTMVNAALITMVAKYVFPYSWSWSQSFLLGSILSATDPIAVISIMESSGCDPVLTTIINGESLLNDGVAYVLFEVFLQWVEGSDMAASSIVRFVFKASLGGPALGIAFAIGTMVWLQILFNDSIAEITVTLTAAYSLWTLSDQILSVSAVLAVLFFSIFLGMYGKNHIGSKSIKAFDFFWKWVDWVANTLIFFLAGLIIATEISNRNDSISGKDWGMAFSLYFLLIPIRMISIIILYPILSFGRYGLKFKDFIVLSWSGLRGAVGLTLALIVYGSDTIQDEEFRVLCFFNVGVIATLTLLIQGTTTGYLLKFLGYTQVPETKRHVQIQSAELIHHIAISGIEEAKIDAKNGVLGPADWELVSKLSTVEVNKYIELRGGESMKKAALKKMASAIHEDELIQDLRDRFLRALKANYYVAFLQEYLTPAEISLLTSSVEQCSDNLEHPLSDWKALHKKFDLSMFSTSVTGDNSWRGRIACMGSAMRKFAVRREGPLQSFAVRNAAMTATFICAHSESRRQLTLFVKLEEGEVNRRKAEQDTSMVTTSPTLGHIDASKFHHEDDIKPFWDTAQFDEIRKINLESFLRKQASSFHPDFTQKTESESLLHHMVRHDLILVDDVRRILGIVLEESRDEQRQAESFLNRLRTESPEELLDVSTEFFSRDILKRQSKMLDFFLQLGLLEKEEVMCAQGMVYGRMKRLHGHHYENE
jgi:NhaP-type Na+/H+ or K+/H+ antiporter